jgi:hypothetical protein
MTLVVAGIAGDHITMVSDTKVTWTFIDGHLDAARNRATYFEALPKIVRLRGDLIIGVAGDDPKRVIERLIARRQAPIESVLAHLESEDANEFVVAALNPTRLWEVKYGSTDDRTTVPRRGWAGDRLAWDTFRVSFDGHGMANFDLDFRLMAAMQTLTSFDPVESAGGLTLKVSSRSGEFLFEAMYEQVMPPMDVTALDVAADSGRMTISVPPGGDTTTHQVIVIPGGEPTCGAVGFLIPETTRGLFFPEDRPWDATILSATSVQEMASRAAEIGTTLTAPAAPSGFK